MQSLQKKNSTILSEIFKTTFFIEGYLKIKLSWVVTNIYGMLPTWVICYQPEIHEKCSVEVAIGGRPCLKKRDLSIRLKKSSDHLIFLVEGGHSLAKHDGADVDHTHDPRQGHELVHKRV